MQPAPYCRFTEFIAPEADRFSILTALLDELDLKYERMDIAGNRHLFVFPVPPERALRAGAGQEPGGRAVPAWGQTPIPVILVAHYDRTAYSPGANDNSAAVFQLIETAMSLKEKRVPRWLIIFTDKEELCFGEGIRDQGSYTLARKLRKAGFGGSRFYIFDACGVGDTLVISTTTDRLLRDEEGPGIPKTRRLARELRNWALEAARNLRMEKVILLPTPFSDDAGFLRAGIAAQTITVLPSQEAGCFAAVVRKNPDFAGALLSRKDQAAQDRQLIPETWRSLNGPGDSPLKLTPQHYKQVVRFACALCRGRL
jgi:hypothetical protein